MTVRKESALSKITKGRNFGLMMGLIVLLIIAAIFTPAMYSTQSILNMLRNYSVFGFLAIGVMFVILTGGIDLSIASTLGLAGIITTRLMAENHHIPAFVWVLVGIGVGIVCGLINGILVGYLKMVPMIATLGTMFIYRGLAFVTSGGNWWFPHEFTDSFVNITIGRTFGVFNIIWIFLIAIILTGIFLGYTGPGRRIYAIGTNMESAKIAGIKSERTTLLAFTLSGAFSGLTGMLFVSNYAVASHTIGMGFEMTAIAICILGGVSIAGGRGRIDGVVIAFLMMSIINYFISLLPGFSVWQNAIQGGIIIIAVLINVLTLRSSERNILKERGRLI